jgi:hypothetical protein
MRTVFLALLVLGASPIFAQNKQSQPLSKVFVKANDIDSDTDRFRLRMIRELKNLGLIVVEKPSDADFILIAALQHGTRPNKLERAKIDVTLTRRDGNPFTTTTTWSSASAEGFESEVQKIAAKNIVELEAPIHTVTIDSVVGVNRKALAEYVANQGYRLVDSDADLAMSVKGEKNEASGEEDFASVQFEVRNQAGDLYSSGTETASDPHFYFEPLDVIASVAIKTAKNVPVRPYRLKTR